MPKFRLLLRMHRTNVTASTKNEFECIERNLITSILTTYHVKLTQSTALGQKRLDLRLLSPALCSIRLLQVMYRNFLLFILSVTYF